MDISGLINKQAKGPNRDGEIIKGSILGGYARLDSGDGESWSEPVLLVWTGKHLHEVPVRGAEVW